MLGNPILPAKHTVLLYEQEDDFLAALVPFVTGGIEAGEGVIAVALPENLAALRDALGSTPPWVRFVDVADWYARPPDTMGRWVTFTADQLAVGRPGVRIIGEVVWPADPRLQREMRRFETAATVTFDALPTLAVCPYSKTRYPPTVIEAALATHPGVIENGVASASPTHVRPQDIVPSLLPELLLPQDVDERQFEPFDVVGLATFVESNARRARLDERRVQMLVAGVSDLAANSFAHARSPVYVSTWVDGEQFACQLEDEGGGIDDPAVGYHPPHSGDDRWGLWLARRRVDLLEVGRGNRGTVVRMFAARRLRTAASSV